MSHVEVEWTHNSLRAVREQARWLRERTALSPSAWIDSLFAAVNALTELPYLGAPWRGGDDTSIRQLVVEKHVVIYRVYAAEHRVRILAVRHHAQRPMARDELE